MRKWITLFGTAALTLSLNAWAHDDMKGMDMDKTKAGAKTITASGEILDMACFMDGGEHGAKHKSCSKKCVKGGSPVGFLSDEGKAYFLVNDHDKEEAFEAAKGLAGETVTLSGNLIEQNGAVAIQVESVEKSSGKHASATATKKYVCSMDGYTSDKPGKCPKCGMDLVLAE
jgi:hypothetical protein